MLRLTENNKKYIFIGITLLLLIVFLFPKSNKKSKKECCGGDLELKDLKKVYNNKSNGETPTMMNFNTNWCGFSRQFEPVWNQFSSKMEGKNIKVQSIKCDQPGNEELCKKYNVQGFPTVLLVANNNTHEFNGNRTVNDLEKFANQHCKL